MYNQVMKNWRVKIYRPDANIARMVAAGFQACCNLEAYDGGKFNGYFVIAVEAPDYNSGEEIATRKAMEV